LFPDEKVLGCFWMVFVFLFCVFLIGVWAWMHWAGWTNLMITTKIPIHSLE
jgi:hypothetical protein